MESFNNHNFVKKKPGEFSIEAILLAKEDTNEPETQLSGQLIAF
jgi:hypothetical protein